MPSFIAMHGPLEEWESENLYPHLCSFLGSSAVSRIPHLEGTDGGLGETPPTGDPIFTSVCTDFPRTRQGGKAEKDPHQAYRILTTCSIAHKGLGEERKNEMSLEETRDFNQGW